ncbi:MAG: LamG domain-containing protein, partial [Cytophagia bacterium]
MKFNYLKILLGAMLFLFLISNNAKAQNNALNFDGSDDFVSIPHNAALKPATNVTVEAWIFATSIPSTNNTYAHITRKEDSNDRVLFAFQREAGVTTLSFGLGVGGTYSELDVPINASDYLNRWVHVAAVYNGTNRIIYRNGVVIGTDAITGGINTGGGASLMIGSLSGGQAFNGNIDEFRFWNVARTQAQIQSGMTTELAGTETGLVAYYNFNQGVANGTNTGVTTLNDLATTVGGANNGTLTNFALTGTTSNWVGRQLASPGGVSNNLRLWLKADAGVTQTTGVSQWNDQSPNELNAVSGSNPTFVASGLNFNPTILFNGTSHRLATASTSLFSSNSSPVSFFTVFNRTASGQRFLLNQRFNNNCATNIQLGYSTGSGGVGNYGLHIGCGRAAVAPDGTIPVGNYQMMSALILNTGASPSNVNIFKDGASMSVVNNGTGFTGAGAYETSTQNVPIEIGVRNDSYLGGSYDAYHQGNIGEIITYTSTPTVIERRRIESYLALKYGISIDQSTATDYLASDGTTEMWNKDLAGAVTYDNSIAGIGRDDASALNQKQSRSINTNTPLTIGLGTVATTNALNTNTFSADRRFLTWGDDNATLASVSTSNVPNTGFPRRMLRIWQAQEPNGDVGSTQIVLDITFTGLTGTTANEFTILIDNDTNFSNGIANSIRATTVVGSIVTFNAVNLANGQYFTFANSLGTTSSAVRGNMASFDGSNDLINAGDINALDGASAITLETWLFVPSGSWPTSGMIMSKQDGGNPSSFNRIELSLSGGTEGGTNDILVVVGGSPSINANYYTNTDIIQYNVWYHVAMVFDGTLTGDANRLKLYINGVQQSMTLVGTSVPAITPSTNSGALCMGTRQGGTLSFRGSLEEARVWNTARTQAQIRESMHLTLSGAENGLVAYYQFNETTGNAVDAVGGNNGTLQNGATRITSEVAIANGTSQRITPSIGLNTFTNA